MCGSNPACDSDLSAEPDEIILRRHLEGLGQFVLAKQCTGCAGFCREVLPYVWESVLGLFEVVYLEELPLDRDLQRLHSVKRNYLSSALHFFCQKSQEFLSEIKNDIFFLSRK